MTALSPEHNIASLLTEAAGKWPDRAAVIAPRRPDALGRGQLTYKELDEASNRLAGRLLAENLAPGSRAMVLLKPGPDFVSVIFGLFKAGLVPVMADPGMGLRRMLHCLSQVRPKALIGIGAAHFLSFLLPRYFKSIKTRVAPGRFPGFRLKLAEIYSAATPGDAPPLPVPARADGLAAVLFTSGATGPAKGVVYTHAMFRAQVRAIREGLDIREGGLDLATFPLFALFAPALGLTSVIPDINAAAPGRANPQNLAGPIIKYGISSMFASPALLGNLNAYAAKNGLKFPALGRVIMAGAPAQPPLVESFGALLPPHGFIQTPYGATEGMPLTTIKGLEITGETGRESWRGLCVGRPLSGVDLKIIKISDGPIARLSDDLFSPEGEIGEITARGPMLSPAYFRRPKETALSIIEDGDGFWRRMGDVGWMDGGGRLWFCGRKAHRVETAGGVLFSVPVESVFNRHPLVRRSALVGLGPKGAQNPVIIIEPVKWRGLDWPALVLELKDLAKTSPAAQGISGFLKYRRFPVDARHNAKINREKLALWALGQRA